MYLGLERGVASDRVEDAVSAHGPFLPGLFHQGTAHRKRGCPHAAASSPTNACTAAAAIVVGAAERPADAPQLWTLSHPEGDISNGVFFFFVQAGRVFVLVSAGHTLVQVGQVDVSHVGPGGGSSAASGGHPLLQQIPAVQVRLWTSSATINPATIKPKIKLAKST